MADQKPTVFAGLYAHFYNTITGLFEDKEVRCEADGSLWVADAPRNFVPYSDATYSYFCVAAPGTPLATAAWQVLRKNNSTGAINFAGTGAYNQLATSLAVVQALPYTAGY